MVTVKQGPKKGDADRRGYGGCAGHLVLSEHCEAAKPVQVFTCARDGATSVRADLRTVA